jgi:hypothetical protein
MMKFFKGRNKKDYFKKNRRHSWIGHTFGHNKFVVKRLEGAISGKGPWEDLDYNTYSKSPETQQ